MSSNASGSSEQSFSCTTQASFLEKIRSGDEHAWFEFHRKYADMIRQVGASKGLSQSECDDLMVEVMVIFWKKMDHFIYDAARGKFRSYLRRIAEVLSLDFLRKKYRQNSSLQEHFLHYPEYVDADCMDEWRDFLLKQAMGDLRESVDAVSYQVFHMSFIGRHTIREISAVTRKSPNAIYIIRSRCIRKLKKIIAAYRQFGEESFSSLHSQRNS